MGRYPRWTDAQDAVLYREAQRLIKQNGGQLPTASSPLWETLPDEAQLRTDHASTDQYPVHYRWMMWCLQLGLNPRVVGKKENAELPVRRELAGVPRYTREGWPDGTPTVEHLRKARTKLRKRDSIFGTDTLNSAPKAAGPETDKSSEADDAPRTPRGGAEFPMSDEDIKRDVSRHFRQSTLAASASAPLAPDSRRSSRLGGSSIAIRSQSASVSLRYASTSSSSRGSAPEPEKPILRVASLQSPRTGTKHTFDLIVSVARKRRNAEEVAGVVRVQKRRVDAGA